MTAKRPLILIVDDAPQDIALYKRYLTRGRNRRYRIREAATAAKALAICRRRMPDCVLLGFRLPDLNGLEALQALADKSRILPCAVVMLAEDGDMRTVVEAMKYGAHDFLEKRRVTRETLERAIANAIEKASLQREVEEQRRELALKNLMLEQQLADLRREMNERRQVEEALAASERRFKRLVEALPGVVWMADEKGSVTYKNDYWTELTGLAVEEGLGDGWMATAHPDDLPRIVASWERAAAAGEPHEAPLRYRRWDGEYRWHLDRSVPLRDEDGVVREWVGVSIDVHDRYEAEEALGESEARYRALVEASSQLVWTADANGIGGASWRWWSEVTGVPAEALARGRWIATVHPDDRRAVRAVWARSREAQAPFEIEFRLRARDGEYRHYNARGVPLFAGGEFNSWIGTLDDVTDRRRAEEALKLANERFTVAEAAANGYIYDRDPESNHVERSAGFSAVLGYNESEAAGPFDWWKTLIHPDDAHRVTGMLEQARRSRKADGMDGYSLEYRIRHKDGRYLWVWDRGRLMRDEKGRVARIIGSVVDISGRKQIENSLRESESRLKLAIAAMNGGAWEWDLVTDKVRWSDEMYELFDRRPGDFTPSVGGWLKSLSAEDRARARAAIEAVRRGDDARMEYRVNLPEGGARWLELRGITLHDERGRPVTLVGITIDITERKLAEESLRQTEALAHTLAAHLSDGMIYQICRGPDGSRRFLYISENVERLRGVTAKEAMANADALYNLIPEEYRARMIEAEDAALRDFTEFRFETPFLTPDGELRWSRQSSTPRRLSDGSVVWDGVEIDITERKRAEEALRESEERFRTMANAIPSIIWMASPDGTITFYNQQWVDYCGVAPEENGDWMRLVIHPGDLERCFAEWACASELGYEFETEIRFRRSDGEYRWFLVRATPSFDAQGRIVKWFGVSADIHDRKEAEEAVRENKERLKLAMEAAGMFVWETDLATGRVTWSDFGEQMVGMEPGSFGGTYDAFLSLVHPDDRESVVNARRRALNGEASYEVEYRKIRPGGGVQWCLSRGIVYRDEEGLPARLVGVSVDITNRKQMEEALRVSEQRYRLLARASSQIVITADGGSPDTGAEWWEELTGQTCEEARNQGWMKRVHPDDRDAASATWRKAAAEQEPFESEFRVLARGGDYHWLHFMGAPILDAEGRFREWVMAMRDITERKEAEERLREKERFIKSLIDAVPAGIYIHDLKENRNLFVNPRLASMLGYAPDELKAMGTDFLPLLLHPEDWRRAYAHFETLKEAPDGSVLEIEYRMKHRDGQWRWVLNREMVFMRNTDGWPLQILGVAQEITERKLAEEDLQRANRRYQIALEALDGYIYEYNVRDNASQRSKGLAKLIGFEPEDAAPQLEWWIDRIHPDDRDHFRSEAEKLVAEDPALRGETHYSIEYRLLHKEGYYVDVLDRSLTVRDADGRPTQIVGAVINITERKRAEEALREKEERLRMAMEAANAGSFDWDIPSGVIIWTPGRRASSRTHNIEQDYQSWRASVHPEDIEWVEADIAKTLAERRDLFIEYRAVRPDGSIRWVSNIGHPFYNEAGQPVRMKGLRIDLTDRKRAEELLRQSEERLRLALEGAKAGVWEVKFDPYSAYWSKEYRDLFGFSETDEATNELWATRVHPDDLQRVVDGNNALLSSDQNEMRQEFRIIHPEIGERWILDFVRVRRDQAGCPISFGGINLDVTDRKRAEEALRESEERFRELVETISDVFWIMRPDSQAPAYLSPACERLWGRPANELNGNLDRWFDAIHHEDRERVRKKYIEKAREGGYDEIYRIVRPDGSMVWVHDRGFPVCDEAGNIRHIVGVAEDITERKEFEDELRESQRRYAALAEAVPQLVWTAGPDGAVDYFNQRWYAYTGATPDGSLDQGWQSLIHPDDRERVEKLWKKGARSGEHLHFEFRLRGADGAYRWFIGRGVPYRDERRGAAPKKQNGMNAVSGNGASHEGGKGRVIKWFGTFTDIHDLKMAEEALRVSEEQARRQNAELENIYQATPVGLSLLDRDLKFVRINETMARMNGCAVEEALGRTAREVTPNMADRLEPIFRRVIRTGRPIMNLEITGETPREPGVERNWLASYYPVKAADGSVQGIGCVVLDITDRKRAEAVVRESEERLRQAAQAAGFGLYSVNLKTGENYWSPELRRIFGLSDDDDVALDKSLGLIHPDDREETMRVIEAALNPRGDGEFEHEFRALLPDGTTRWALARGRTLFSGKGRRRKAARIIGVAFDITERKEAEERLHASEELFRTIFDLSGIGILQIDPATGLFLRANREFCDWLGYSEDELLKMKLEEIAHPDDLGERWTDIGRFLHGEADEHFTETRCVRKDGGVVWGLITSRMLRDAGGRPLRTVTAVTDITERKRAEEALRESERRLKLSLAAGRAGTWEWRIKEDKLIWSDEYYDLYGMSPGDLEPTLDNFILRVHSDDRDRILAELGEVLKERKDAELEFRFIGAGGDVRWAHSSAQLTLDESGEPERLVGIMIDITTRVQAELEREDLLRKEREAREQAEAANRGKDEFVAMVSHELRSPLNAMLGWSKILKKGGVDEKTQSHAVEVIERSARAQQNLIEDLLDMARIVGGKLRLETRPVSLARVVEAAVDVVRPTAQVREVELRLFIKSADEVTGDADRLQQVVWNLLSNAVKFTPRGGSVEVVLERVDASAQITVTDTGRGIKAEDLPFIFDRFRQADGSSNRRFAGLGLGLALVKHLVELHGGQVSADSPGEGKGASFIVKLPVRAVRGEATPARGLDRENLRSEERDGRAPERESWGAYPVFPLDGVWALIVDDEADARELIATLLRQYGARVTVASCAAEALNKLREGEAGARPDVLVSDISMPDEDGYMLIERVRKLPAEEGGKIPAIALTALERPSDRIKALASGFSMHVPKPVEPEELAMVIANLTGHPAGIIV